MDWIGSKTPDRFTETPWSTSSRGALDYPDFDEEYFEWIDLLESVSDAKSTFVFLELGAGYGRWSARAAHAARQKNKLYRLGLAEASPDHVAQLQEMMKLNDVATSDYEIFNVAISGHRGVVQFKIGWPDGLEPKCWYGQAVTTNDMLDAVCVGEKGGFPLLRMRDGWKVITIPTTPLSDVIRLYDFVDLADFDLQGTEADAIEESIDQLNSRVRRLHIGTHSREIEHRLRDLLFQHGWRCLRDFQSQSESDTPFGRIRFIDGVQSWINPRL